MHPNIEAIDLIDLIADPNRDLEVLAAELLDNGREPMDRDVVVEAGIIDPNGHV